MRASPITLLNENPKAFIISKKRPDFIETDQVPKDVNPIEIRLPISMR